MKSWLAITALCLAGCTNSSSSPVAVPQAVPALATPQASETTYIGFLAHIAPSLSTSVGWRLRNVNLPGSVPIDVTNVASEAKTLVNRRVVVQAHSAQESNGQMVLMADSMTAFSAIP